MKKSIKKATQLLTVLLLILITVLSGLNFPVNTYADGTAIADNGFDKTDPITDLSGDESFDISNYPYNESGDISLASFNEYCYSFYSENRSNFAIYIYIYNPAAENLEDSSLNKIQMAVGYDGEGNPNDYEKFELKLCAVSGGDYARLFYKFKVIDHLTNNLTIYDRLNSNRRRYDVSGIELISGDAVNATDKNVSKTFYFTGYAKGYGPDFSAPESTLKCEYENLETVELNVMHTFWRSQTSNRGAGYQNQIDTVYFSIPNRFLRDYGKLQRIKAEWYEYLTKDIVVTSNQEFYNLFRDEIGNEPPSVINDKGIYKEVYQELGYYYCLDSFNYLFPTKNWCDIKNYDPYADIEEIGGVSSNRLYNYILNYNKTFANGTVKDGRISADLFESDIEDYRKIDNEFGKIQYGYSYYDFDADVDLFDLISYNPDNHDFGDNVLMYGFFRTLFGRIPDDIVEESFTGQTPILLLNKDEYLDGNPQDVSDRLFVNYNDVDKIKSAVQDAKKNDETVVLFRFAVSDYYAADAYLVNFGDALSDHIDRKYDVFGLLDAIGIINPTEVIEDQAYRAKESVFLDFDIIQLTFNKDGVLTVIPVVSSPIDIVDDITVPYTPPSAGDNVLAWIVFFAAAIIGIVIISYALKFINDTIESGIPTLLKAFIILLIISVVIVIAYFAVPFVVNLIKDLGGF